MKTIKLNDAIEYEIQKTELEINPKWCEDSYIPRPPQSQSIIWVVLWLGTLFGIAVITWYSIVYL